MDSKLLPGEKFGPYRIDRLLGRGGMAEVYRAWHCRLERFEAVKVLLPEMATDDEFVDRFLAEARTAARLTHPNVIRILSVSSIREPEFCFSMEMVEGCDLAAILRERGPLVLEEALTILRQVASALDYAHSMGVVHRDIKPANVLLHRESSGHWGVKVVDFGIARAHDSDGQSGLTSAGMVMGTPEYMSPEQARGDASLDWRSDIYSLGVVAYEMICGLLPFTPERSPLQDAAIVPRVSQTPRPPHELNPAIPRHVSHGIMRALANRPDERFASCSELIQALTERPPATVTVPPVVGRVGNYDGAEQAGDWISRQTAFTGTRPMAPAIALMACLAAICFIAGALNKARSPASLAPMDTGAGVPTQAPPMRASPTQANVSEKTGAKSGSAGASNDVPSAPSGAGGKTIDLRSAPAPIPVTWKTSEAAIPCGVHETQTDSLPVGARKVVRVGHDGVEKIAFDEEGHRRSHVVLRTPVQWIVEVGTLRPVESFPIRAQCLYFCPNGDAIIFWKNHCAGNTDSIPQGPQQEHFGTSDLSVHSGSDTGDWRVRTLTVAPDGSWMILYGNRRHSYGEGFAGMPGLSWAAYTPSGGWIASHGGSDLVTQGDVPDAAEREIQRLQSQGFIIRCVSFAPDNSFVIIYDNPTRYSHRVDDQSKAWEKNGSLLCSASLTPAAREKLNAALAGLPAQ